MRCLFSDDEADVDVNGDDGFVSIAGSRPGSTGQRTLTDAHRIWRRLCERRLRKLQLHWSFGLEERFG